MLIKATLLLSTLSCSVVAQPIVHNIAEQNDAREEALDLTILSGGEIAFVGHTQRQSQNLRQDGYIVVNNARGIPVASWIIEDNDSSSDQLLATYEDPFDKDLIVLQQGIINTNPVMRDLVLFKIDPFTGAITYQWRYEGNNALQKLGMERDGDTGLIAASVLDANGGTECTLLRFRNSTGLRIFHNRYIPINYQAFDMRFFDVAVDEESGDIFAVGSAVVDDPERGFSPGSEILIARFDSAGAPIWFRVHEPRPTDAEAPAAVGVSVEINADGNPAVVARQTIPGLGPIPIHLVFDRATGTPTAVSALTTPDISEPGIFPEYASLEQLPDGSMIIAGDYLDQDRVRQPAVWNIKGSNTAFNWIYSPDVQFGSGNSAIPQPNAPDGPSILLAGRVYPHQGPIGTFYDALLARTQLDGTGLCNIAPNIQPIPVDGITQGFDIQPRPIELPVLAGIEVIEGDAIHKVVCEPCPADLNMDGSLDFFDLSYFLTNMIDWNGDTVFDFFDISAYLQAYGAGCP